MMVLNLDCALRRCLQLKLCCKGVQIQRNQPFFEFLQGTPKNQEYTIFCFLKSLYKILLKCVFTNFPQRNSNNILFEVLRQFFTLQRPRQHKFLDSYEPINFDKWVREPLLLSQNQQSTCGNPSLHTADEVPAFMQGRSQRGFRGFRGTHGFLKSMIWNPWILRVHS